MCFSVLAMYVETSFSNFVDVSGEWSVRWFTDCLFDVLPDTFQFFFFTTIIALNVV